MLIWSKLRVLLVLFQRETIVLSLLTNINTQIVKNANLMVPIQRYLQPPTNTDLVSLYQLVSLSSIMTFACKTVFFCLHVFSCAVIEDIIPCWFRGNVLVRLRASDLVVRVPSLHRRCCSGIELAALTACLPPSSLAVRIPSLPRIRASRAYSLPYCERPVLQGTWPYLRRGFAAVPPS